MIDLDHFWRNSLKEWSKSIISEKNDPNRSFFKKMIQFDHFAKLCSKSKNIYENNRFGSLSHLDHWSIWNTFPKMIQIQKWSKTDNDPNPTMIQIDVNHVFKIMSLNHIFRHILPKANIWKSKTGVSIFSFSKNTTLVLMKCRIFAIKDDNHEWHAWSSTIKETQN